MRAIVPTGSRFLVTPDGTLWTPHTYRSYGFWKRYLDVYDELLLLAPADPRPRPPESWNPATGPGVGAVVRAAGRGRGILATARLALEWRAHRRELFGLHLRLPSLAGSAVAAAGLGRRPFGVELVGDPMAGFERGQLESRLRVLAEHGMAADLRRLCRRATAVAYTTSLALQRRYPPSAGAFTTSYSSLDLTPEHFREPREIITRDRGPYVLSHVGSMSVLSKGHSIVLRALAECLASGHEVELRFVGDGRYLGRFQAEAERLGVARAVRFLGRLPRDEQVRAELDRADLFVIHAQDGGLPRALLEAMARGRPCIASGAGGAPEVLPPDALVPPHSPAAMAGAIKRALSDSAWRRRMAHVNRDRAEAHRCQVLRARRIEFYDSVKRATRNWYRAG